MFTKLRLYLIRLLAGKGTVMINAHFIDDVLLDYDKTEYLLVDNVHVSHGDLARSFDNRRVH